MSILGYPIRVKEHFVLYRPHPLAIGGGMIAGLLVSFPLLIGDASGRVNLLHLLVLYVGFPVLGLVVSLVSLFLKGKTGIGTLLSRVAHRWPSWRTHFREWRRRGLGQTWITVQTQWLAMAFSIGSMLALITALLFSDTHFVWRSTLLAPAHLEPFLQQVARPWAWLGWGQPSLELLEATRDVRLGPTIVDVEKTGHWWRFLLACQLFYGVGLRLLTLTLAVLRKDIPAETHDNTAPDESVTDTGAQEPLAEMMQSPVTPSAILPWGDIPDSWIAYVQQAANASSVPVHPLDDSLLDDVPQPWLVLVKSWEPPLGELADVLRSRTGMIVPVDGQGDTLRPPRPEHMKEWRRFAAQCGDWTVWEVLP